MGGLTLPAALQGGGFPPVPMVPLSLPAVQLASASTLAAAAVTTIVSPLVGASYIFAYVLASGSGLILEALGPDGATWLPVVTVNASGSQGVVIGDGASVRLRNSSGASITGLSASLS